ncbi:MAG: hypothetical protein EOS36_14910 [Mesorhizobium sp.]|uniref:hypothetical protein n=1 Tax=Mesorhizobium sp. TaxID=1871066 RepID=UPI000FE5605A|nr:hypothetical protein [Mesorhizobium sp.]RWD62550.1 MAG: hypothetical protein EOS36_14910 [Mesorhizobium sp.]RWE39609.1 MAG: hypothetical protein EOS79_20515 [Mesorhizobium sp.]
MLSDTAAIAAASDADAHANGRPLAIDMLDRRTREWRRRRELIAVFTASLGATPISPMLSAKIETAAELAVVAEMTRASFMAGAGAVADDVVRTANQAARAEKALGIAARNARPAKPSLDAYLSGSAA